MVDELSARARRNTGTACSPAPRVAPWLQIAALVFLQSLGPAPAHAQEVSTVRSGAAEPDAEAKVGKQLLAFRIAGAAPQIDGRLNDDVWQAVDQIADFVQWEPDNLAPLSERTVVQVAYDDRYLYIAVRCFDQDPSGITAGLGRRDTRPPTDWIEVGFDPQHDHLTAYVYEANPSGVQGDFEYFDDTRLNRDYDGVWEVGTQVTAEGWMAEFRIPFSQMRFVVPSDGNVIWGFTVRRTIYRKGEYGEWTGRARGEQGNVSRWGHLVFADRLVPPHRVELLPFTLARREELAGVSPEHGASVGLDVRMGLGTSATLSVTINPDFAQVEQDPAVLNLTVFETFFPEKRPFFLEDSRIFIPPRRQFRLFHSRRIGQRPGRFGLQPGDRLVDRPDETTILGAVKVTGKANTWTYGALTGLTSREYATVDAVSVGEAGNETVRRANRLIEPLASYNVARVQRDVLGGSSNVGAIATAVVRERDADAVTGGIDYNIRWARNLFNWNGTWMGTRAPFGAATRAGFGGVTNLDYVGKHVEFNSNIGHISRNFRNADLGFLMNSRVDKTDLDVAFVLRQPDPWGVLRSLQSSIGGGQGWNGDRVVFERFMTTGVNGQFRNFWDVNLSMRHDFRAMDDLDTRGGPPIVRPAESSMTVSVSSDSRKTWQVTLGLAGARDEEGGWAADIEPEVRLQPSDRLQLALTTSYRSAQDVAQWITNRDVNGDARIDHVYGRLRRDVVDVAARATYGFSRDMTLEVFLQPFVAVGDYTDIRRLAQPFSFAFAPAALPFDPDFNRKSLRGNTVLRWEYVRGSTLFFVWNMSTLDVTRPGVFTPLEDLGSAFRAEGTYVFMVKMTYWLGL
jgi:uncharacterized protein DUF5916/cellulose/xylan binding protein with CBM9 domain